MSLACVYRGEIFGGVCYNCPDPYLNTYHWSYRNGTKIFKPVNQMEFNQYLLPELIKSWAEGSLLHAFNFLKRLYEVERDNHTC